MNGITKNKLDLLLSKFDAMTEIIVTKEHFEKQYHVEMSKEQWRNFRYNFPDCVMRKPGTNFWTINVTKWRQCQKPIKADA